MATRSWCPGLASTWARMLLISGVWIRSADSPRMPGGSDRPCETGTGAGGRRRPRAGRRQPEGIERVIVNAGLLVTRELIAGMFSGKSGRVGQTKKPDNGLGYGLPLGKPGCELGLNG